MHMYAKHFFLYIYIYEKLKIKTIFDNQGDSVEVCHILLLQCVSEVCRLRNLDTRSV